MCHNAIDFVYMSTPATGMSLSSFARFHFDNKKRSLQMHMIVTVCNHSILSHKVMKLLFASWILFEITSNM